jgi:hypothetical protein
MVDTRLALTGQPINMMMPHEAIQAGYQTQAMKQRNAMTDMAMQDAEAAKQGKARLNALYQQHGGDFDKMLASGQLDMDTAVGLMNTKNEQAKLQGEAAKQNAQADKARMEGAIEKLNYGSQLLQGATPDNWQDIRKEFYGMTGQDLGEQFDPNKVAALQQQGLAMKDKLDNEWKAKGYDLDVARFGETRRHNQVSEGISQQNANKYSSTGGGVDYSKVKLPAGYVYNPETGQAERIPGLPDDAASAPSLSSTELTLEGKVRDSIYKTVDAKDKMAVHLKALEDGTLVPSKMLSAKTKIAAETGYMGDDKTAAMASLLQDAQEARDAILSMEMGVKTDQDAERAYQRIISSVNDPDMLKESVKKLYEQQENAILNKQLQGESIRRNAGAPIVDYAEEYKSKKGGKLPEGVTEDDVQETMRVRNMTREQVLQKLRGR